MFRENWQVGQTGHTAAHNAIAMHLNRSFNVKDYGAKGNGSADDTAALLATIAAARAVTGVVIVPPGHYLFNQPLYIQYVSFMGASLGTILDYRGSGQALIVGDLVGTTLYEGSQVSDFMLDGSQSTNGTAGITVCNAAHFTLARLQTVNFATGNGMNLQDAAFSGVLVDCVSKNNLTGLQIYKTFTDGYINAIRILGGEYAACGVGIQIGISNPQATAALANGVTIKDAVIEGNTTGINITQGYTVHISDSYFEACVNEAVRVGTPLSAPTMIDIDHCWVYNTPVAVEAVAVRNLNVERNYFHYNTPIGVRLHSGVVKSAIVNNHVFDGNVESVAV